MAASLNIQPKRISQGIRQRSLGRGCRFGRATELVAVFVTTATVMLGSSATADDLFWDPGSTAVNPIAITPPSGGSGTWDLATGNWWNETTTTPDVTFGPFDDAFFTTTGGTVTIDNGGATLTARSITVRANAYTFAGATAADTLRLTTGDLTVDTAGHTVTVTTGIDTALNVLGAGNVTLLGGVGGNITQASTGRLALGAGTYGGGLDINAGTVRVDGDATVTGFVTVDGAATLLSINDGVTLTADAGVRVGTTVAGARLDVNGNLTRTGGGVAIENDGGVVELGDASGTTTVTGKLVQDGGTTRIFGATVITEVVDINAGSLTVDDGVTLVADSGGTTANDLTLQGNSRLAVNGGTVTGNVLVADTATVDVNTPGGNTGTIDGNLRHDSTGASALAGTITGTLDVNAGSFRVDGASAVTGLVTVDGAATVLSVDDGVTLTTDAGVRVGAADAGARLDIDGDLTRRGRGVAIDNRNGRVQLGDGAGTSTVTGALAQSGGTTRIFGETIFTQSLDLSGGSLTVDDGIGLVADSSGTASTDLTLNGNATLIVNGGFVTGNVVLGGSATFDVNTPAANTGTITGNVRQDSTGASALAGTITGTLDINAGSVRVNGASTVTGLVTVDGATTRLSVNDGETLTADAGVRVGAAGAGGILDINGDLTRTGGGLAIFNDGGAVQLGDATGTTTVTGRLVQDGGTTRVVGSTTITEVVDINAGSLTVDDGATLVADSSGTTINDVTLGGNSTLAVNGGILTGNVLLADTATFDINSLGANIGTIGGDVRQDSTGASTLAGNITGVLDINAGRVTVDGASTVAGLVTIDGADPKVAGLVVAANQTLTATAGIQLNSGRVILGGGSTLGGNFSTAAGSEVEVNGQTTVNGNLSGSGTFFLDVDLDPLTTSIDSIVVQNGVVDDTIRLDFNINDPSNALLTGNGVVVIDYDEGQQASLNTNRLTANSNLAALSTPFLTYTLQDQNGAAVLVGAASSTVGSIGASIALSQSVLQSVINRPTSPYVSALAAAGEPEGFATWTRFYGGRATATGSATLDVLGNLTTDVDLSYGGFQVGFDYAFFDGSLIEGLDVAFGGTLGVTSGSTTQDVPGFDFQTGTFDPGNVVARNELDFSSKYATLYVVGVAPLSSRISLVSDLQYRFEYTDYTLSSGGAQPVVSNESKFSSLSNTLVGTLQLPISIMPQASLSLIPVIGFSLTRTSTDDVSVDNGGVVSFDDSTTEIGFIGATVQGQRIIQNETAALNYFASYTVYEDFGDGLDSQFSLGGTQVSTATASPLSRYSEVSLGLNYTKILDPGLFGPARQLDAGIRGDVRFGDDIDGYSLTAQVRLQF